jgi:hypothetical protein
MSVKYQITLPVDLYVELKATSARRGMPLAEFIRETMEERLRREGQSCETNPFASITGILNQAPSDLSERVDEILYQ